MFDNSEKGNWPPVIYYSLASLWPLVRPLGPMVPLSITLDNVNLHLQCARFLSDATAAA